MFSLVWLLFACESPDRDARHAALAAEAEAQAAAARKPPAPRPEKPTVPAGPDPVISGFAQPDAAIHDPVADVYLVSNVRGSPAHADNNGFISVVRPDGVVQNLRFIAGGTDGVTLHAPRGLLLVGRELYVADLDTVRVFHADTGAHQRDIQVPGATFLNDLAASPEGKIYVSDTGLGPATPASKTVTAGALEGAALVPTGTDAIWELSGAEPVVLVRGVDLGGPNGLVWLDGGLKLTTWTGRAVLHIGPDGARGPNLNLSAGRLDGLVATPDGHLYVSSVEAGAVLDAGKTPEIWRNALPSPADLGHDPSRHRLLVPLAGEGTVLLLPLPGAVPPPTSPPGDPPAPSEPASPAGPPAVSPPAVASPAAASPASPAGE